MQSDPEMIRALGQLNKAHAMLEHRSQGGALPQPTDEGVAAELHEIRPSKKFVNGNLHRSQPEWGKCIAATPAADQQRPVVKRKRPSL